VRPSTPDTPTPPLRRLRADGGLTQVQGHCRQCADILQVPLDIYHSAHATASGAEAWGLI